MTVPVKSKFLALLLLVAMATVAAQNQPDTSKTASNVKDPLFFIKLATRVAANLHPIDGYLAIYIDQKTWSAARRDGDLGPFVKFKDARPNRSVTCLFSQHKTEIATCVYFDSDRPFGVASVLPSADGRVTASDISAAYKDFSKNMLKERDDDRLSFTSGEVTSDDGTKLIAYTVTDESDPTN